MAVDSACSIRLPSFKFVGDTFSVLPLIGLFTLTFDLLTLNLVRVIDLATLTFNLGDQAGRLYLIRVFVLCLCTKFKVRRSSRSEDMAHFRSQVTLTFDL